MQCKCFSSFTIRIKPQTTAVCTLSNAYYISLFLSPLGCKLQPTGAISTWNTLQSELQCNNFKPSSPANDSRKNKAIYWQTVQRLFLRNINYLLTRNCSNQIVTCFWGRGKTAKERRTERREKKERVCACDTERSYNGNMQTGKILPLQEQQNSSVSAALELPVETRLYSAQLSDHCNNTWHYVQF